MIWGSHDDGATFEGPFPVSPEGELAADQRVAVDDRGTVYVSYLGYANQKSSLQLARSKDGGRTFDVRTVTDKSVSDKPELAVSNDGKNISIVYESHPGPTLISSHDGGETWDEAQVVEPSKGRHFWPMGLAFGAKGDLWFSVPSMDDAELQKGAPTPVALHVFRSTDDGKTWRATELGESPRILGGCATIRNATSRSIPSASPRTARDGRTSPIPKGRPGNRTRSFSSLPPTTEKPGRTHGD